MEKKEDTSHMEGEHDGHKKDRSANVANLYRIIFIIMDHANAVIIAIIFFREGKMIYFWMTLGFIGLNLVVVLLCIILRRLLRKDENKVFLLKLYEAFMGCAPQAFLQLCIIAMEAGKNDYNQTRDILGMVMALKMVLLMAAALTDYNEALTCHEQKDRHAFTRMEVFIYFVSCFGALAARMHAIVFYGVMHPWITLTICGCHFVVMVSWTAFLKHRDESTQKRSIAHKVCVNTAVGIAYILHYFKVIQRQDRKIVFAYFVIFYAESAAMITHWFIEIPKHYWVRTNAFCTFWACAFIGSMSMIYYYVHYYRQLPNMDQEAQEMVALTEKPPKSGREIRSDTVEP